MIGFVFGTTAEVIKAAPVLLAIEPEPFLIFTGQHNVDCDGLLERVGLPQPRFRLNSATAGELASTAQAPAWAARISRNAVRHRKQIRSALKSDGRQATIMVQGDTLTTLAGTLLGKALRAKVAHIEAGARSGDWRNPFPEELVRRTVDRLANLLYSAGDVHSANVARCRGTAINTGVNTGYDGLRLALSLEPAEQPPAEPFGIVTLHRFELLRQEDVLRDTIAAIIAADFAAEKIVMPVDAHSRHYLDRAGVLADLARDPRIVLCPKVPFPTFQHWLVRSRFVITDSGGLSQECGYLGVPCLIHRQAEEGVSGAQTDMRLSGLDPVAVSRFIEAGADVTRPRLVQSPSPSLIIANDLVRRGLADSVRDHVWTTLGQG